VNGEPKLQVEVQTGSERRMVCLDSSLTRGRTARFDDTTSPSSLRAAKVGAETVVFERGEAFAFHEPQSLADGPGATTEGTIRAPMPGRIIAVQIADGAAAVKGQALLTMEAMKMEHTLTAPFDGYAAGLAHKLGDQVSEGTVLLRITRKIAGDESTVRTHSA
jgi:acetyl/propionyl-CoA carboxylase alpha subunit